MCGLDGSLYANFEKVSSLHRFDWFLGPLKIFVFGKKIAYMTYMNVMYACVFIGTLSNQFVEFLNVTL